jgi:hypothetical protein
VVSPIVRGKFGTNIVEMICGLQPDDELTREVNAMIAATREAELQAARRGDSPDEPMIVQIP